MGFVNLQRCFIVYTLFAMIAISQSQSTDPTIKQQRTNGQGEIDLEKKEYELEEQFKNQEQKELNPWVIEEMRHNEKHMQIQPYESAAFILQPNVTQVYRIPVHLAQTMPIEVAVYEMSKQGEILLPQNPSQQNYVKLTSRDEDSHIQITEGKVYIQKIFQLKFTQTHKFLKFQNNADYPLIVLLNIEQEEILMEIALSDDQFAVSNKKMQMILEETKHTQINREHLYKWQWGFYQKHERHQTDMLGFTGVELLAIIGTSIVQMYCIKNLINNQLII